MNIEEEFRFYIRKLRKEKGLTLRELSDLSGVSQSYITNVENGKRSIPSPEILKKMAAPLGVSPLDLMFKAGHIPDGRQLQMDENSEITTMTDSEEKASQKSKDIHLIEEVLMDAINKAEVSFPFSHGFIDKELTFLNELYPLFHGYKNITDREKRLISIFLETLLSEH